MRLAVLVAVAAITSPALADDDCDVRVVRAPKKVRAAIEARTGIESECTWLEVRVTKSRTIGKVRRITVRKLKLPRIQDLCLPPGARKPGRC